MENSSHSICWTEEGIPDLLQDYLNKTDTELEMMEEKDVEREKAITDRSTNQLFPFGYFKVMELHKMWPVVPNFFPTASVDFGLGPQPGDAQGLLLILHLGITSGGSHRIRWGPGNQTQVTIYKTSALPAILSLALQQNV